MRGVSRVVPGAPGGYEQGEDQCGNFREARPRAIGGPVRDAETAGLAGLFPIIILFFTSSALVPVTTMPGWLQAFAKVNPITVITDALRALCLGGPTVRPAAEAVTWLIGLLAVTVPATIARYRHTASTQPRRAGDEQAALAPLLAGSPAVVSSPVLLLRPPRSSWWRSRLLVLPTHRNGG
jgi:ABC-2 family transporter